MYYCPRCHAFVQTFENRYYDVNNTLARRVVYCRVCYFQLEDHNYKKGGKNETKKG